ncbi:Lipoprotein [Comamonas aquatilis]|uniref:hypothetical protein n=1 Tax=Comamonas aquatilis TaxID=1778406 RepID=UPI0039F071FD
MRNRRIELLLMGVVTAAALLAGCSDSKDAAAPAAQPPVAAAPEPASTGATPAAAPGDKRVIDQLFSLETVGMNLAYVEKIAGPAMRSEFHRHQFRSDGCEVTLLTDDADKVVNGVEVAIAPSCNLSLAPLLGGFAGEPPITLNELTFGRYEQMLGGGYYADCLSLCGNAADPVVYLHAEGSRAMHLMEFMVQAPMVSGPVLNATSQWRDAMIKAESEDYVLDTRFNCDPQRFRSVIATGLAAVKPMAFTFGRDLGFPPGECR